MKVKITGDDMAEEKGFPSKHVGKCGTIVEWRKNPDREDGLIPVIKLDNGTVICSKKIWWTAINGATPIRIIDISSMPNFNPIVKNGLHSVTEGKVIWFRQENGIETVYCKEHGACLCLNKDRTLWRCPTCHEGCYIELKEQQ